jgi:putative transposase
VLTAWASRRGIHVQFIQPGKPQENAYIERYNRTVRYDCVAHYLFDSIQEVQDFVTRRLWTYNHERANMAIGGVTPKQKLPLPHSLYSRAAPRMGITPDSYRIRISEDG